MSNKLTTKQQEFLQFLLDQVEATGDMPSYRVIMDHFGYKSPHSVTQHLKALHRKGHLVRRSERQNDNRSAFQLSAQHRSSTEGIPIQGIISAGTLQEAVEVNLGTLTLDYIFPRLDQIFALRVAGNSMSGAGIQDGDYVLIMKGDIPDGHIGAVLYAGETTLKRVYSTAGQGLRLEPVNAEYEDIHIEPGEFEEVTVIGRYVGHVRPSTGTYRRVSPR
jgi:repressor LexA